MNLITPKPKTDDTTSGIEALKELLVCTKLLACSIGVEGSSTSTSNVKLDGKIGTPCVVILPICTGK